VPKIIPCFGLKNDAIFDPGIWEGMHTFCYFDGKTYEWVGLMTPAKHHG